MLHRMAVAFFTIAPNHELWMMAVADPAAGVAATGSITVSAAATTAGTIPLYLAGQNVDVLANGTDTAAQLATKIAAAVNAMASLPVTLANGKTYSLFQAWTKSAFEINAEQGQARVRFEGMSGSEF